MLLICSIIKIMVRLINKDNADFFATLVYGTLRMQQPFTNIKEINNPLKAPCIYAMWHCHQCCIHGIEDKANLNVLISNSIDGEIIARAVEKWGFKTVRGSTGRKGAVGATLAMLDRLKSGECGAMMVDGPRGPARQVKGGVVKIAKMSGAPIVPVFWYSPQWSFLKLKSWDEMRFPFGPTRMINLYGEPIYVPSDSPDENDKDYMLQIQASLEELEKQAPSVYDEVTKAKLWKKIKK